MKRKLYPNMRRLTSLFSVAIVCVTLTTLLLRLTVFSDLAAMAASTKDDPASMVEPEEPGLFPYSLSRKVHIPTPQARGEFKIKNPETNTYYMTVAVILPETGENLLYTGFIKPGESRETAALHIPLEEGTYECIAEITAFDPITLEPRGSEEREITLYIGDKPK